MTGASGRLAARAGRLLRGQGRAEARRPLDPALQLSGVVGGIRPDQPPALYGPAGDVERPDVRLAERRIAPLRAEADDQRVFPDADEHVPAQQEADPAEHRLLVDAPGAGQD